MPATVRPDLPVEVDRAIDALGNRVRFAILRSLMDHGPASATQLAQRLAVGRSLLQAHLRRLEELGVVIREPVAVRSDHRARVFRVDADQVAGLLRSMSRALRR